MYALLLILSLASGVLPRNSPPELGGVPFARFLANGGVVPQATTPSAPGFGGFAAFVAVGMEITLHPPHGSGRTDFPYPALASGQPPKRADG